jgi:hypothetical protein
VKPSFFVALALAVVAVAGVGLVAPDGSSGTGMPQTFVFGAVNVPLTDFPDPGDVTHEQIVVAAQDGPNGPRGLIVFRSPLSAVPVAVADVTCLVVIGNDAWVGGKLRRSFLYGGQGSFPANTITHFSVRIRDNGPPVNGARDAVHPVVFIDRPRPPTFSPCNIGDFNTVLFPVSHGDFVVGPANQS